MTINLRSLTEADIVRAMEVFDRERRETFPERRWRKYAVTRAEDETRRYPPKELLRIAADTDAVPPGGPATNDHFVRLGFRIVCLEESATSEVEDPVIDEALETALSLERDLEKHLEGHLEALEAGLTLYRGEGSQGRQVNVQAAGRIDLLATDREGALVVIELKAGEATDQVCGQILRYMGWVQERLAKGKPVRGIIVANDFSERLTLAAKAMPNVLLKRYGVRFVFSEV